MTDGGKEACSLLGGGFAIGVQVVLLIVSFSALVVKRQCQPAPARRSPKVWAMDVSKQGVSLGAAHFLSIMVSGVLSHVQHGDAQECGWYVIIFTIDTTLGAALSVAGLRLLTRAVRQRTGYSVGTDSDDGRPHAFCLRALQKPGHYGHPTPRASIYACQLVSWTIIVLCARVVCYCIIFAFRSVLQHIVTALGDAFEGHPRAFLVTVMVVCPLLMNTTQYLLVDVVLRYRMRNQVATVVVPLDELGDWGVDSSSSSSSSSGGEVVRRDVLRHRGSVRVSPSDEYDGDGDGADVPFLMHRDAATTSLEEDDEGIGLQ